MTPGASLEAAIHDERRQLLGVKVDVLTPKAMPAQILATVLIEAWPI